VWKRKATSLKRQAAFRSLLLSSSTIGTVLIEPILGNSKIPTIGTGTQEELLLKIQSRDLHSILQRKELDADQIYSAYNALDSAVTLMVYEKLKPLVDASPHATTSYAFVRAMQGPALDMMNRGVAINAKVRQDETERILTTRAEAQELLDKFADAIWGPEEYVEVLKTKETWTPIGKRGLPLTPRTRVVKEEFPKTRPRGLNAGSNKQCLTFFNIALGIPVEYETRKTPEGTIQTPSADEKALKKWVKKRWKGPGVSPYDRSITSLPFAAPFISLILTIRKCGKMLAMLRSALDQDGRMRCSYNVAGTKNGRWSSSKNARGRGTNLQNVTPAMRRMFAADDGYWFVSTDLEQAESRVTGGIVWEATGDDTYLRACESQDLHTTVARMAWPELDWILMLAYGTSNPLVPGLERGECFKITTLKVLDKSDRYAHILGNAKW